MNSYEILGLPYGASSAEVKKAFHRLAHVHHPDKGGDPEKFKQISAAYAELRNNPAYTPPRRDPNVHVVFTNFDAQFGQYGEAVKQAARAVEEAVYQYQQQQVRTQQQIHEDFIRNMWRDTS